VVTVALALTGCAPAAQAPRASSDPPDSAAPSPVFASDEEALAAVLAVYGDYASVTTQIVADRGTNPERIAPYVTDQNLQTIESNLRWFEEHQVRSEGLLTFDNASLQRYEDNGDGTARITTYLCSDVSATRLYAADGSDVTSPGRRERLPLVVEFIVEPEDVRTPRVDSSSLWTGDNFC
jgi:hypothetical protein